MLIHCHMWTTSPQTHILLKASLSCTSLKWHADKRGFHTWWVESSSSFVPHHELLDVLMQPLEKFCFWSDQEAEYHVKERARSDFQWRFIDGKTRANESSVLHNPLSARNNPPQDERSSRSVECWWSTRRSFQLQETGADQPKLRSNRVCSSAAAAKYSKDRLLETGRQGWIFDLSSKELVRAVNTKTEVHNMKISNDQHLTEVFQSLHEKLGITTGYSTFAMETIETNVLRWDRSCLRQWKQPLILNQIMWRIWNYTRTRTSRK